VIVVIGVLASRVVDGTVVPAGPVAAIALAAAEAGSAVQCIAKIGDDPVGDALLLALARAGVGHVATLRDATHPTAILPDTAMDLATDVAPADDPEPAAGDLPGPAIASLDAADVGLALRYLSDHRVIVAVHPDGPAITAEVAAAAGWSGAHLLVIADPAVTLDPPDGAFVLAADAVTAERLGPLVGRYAALVDAGSTPADAFAATLGAAAER
jgi:pfkB family carbohydrate kinase